MLGRRSARHGADIAAARGPGRGPAEGLARHDAHLRPPRAAASRRAADLSGAGDGWRYTRWVTNRPAGTKGWLGQNAYIDAAHRVHARVEDAIRTGKDAGLGHFPSFDYAVNQAWLTAAMTAQILLAWLKLLALDGDLARAEPKTLRYRLLHAAARLVRGARRRRLKIQATWPWAAAIQALPHST
jgi:hypothetical protein